MMRTLVSIGDGIIDAVEFAPGDIRRFPGGAALNLAVGAARLGLCSRLVTRYGTDRDGFLLDRHLREEGVEVLNPPNVDFTGVVRSTRANGEPTYHFNPVMFRRRILFTEAVADAIREADAVAVNSFPFDDPGQVDALVRALGQAKGVVIVDPNPRPNVIADVPLYRLGAERAMRIASIAKLSDEDIALLYGETSTSDIATHVFGLGVATILFTHGARGAAVTTRDGLSASVPIATGEGPVIDAMGAGDATLATAIAHILHRGMPSGEDAWRACLDLAMRVAAATCAAAGGALRLPAGGFRA
jgi:fructokinase